MKKKRESARQLKEKERLALLEHKPTTGILNQIEKAGAKQQLLEKVSVTPEIAKDLLTLNKSNRPITIPTVNRYTEMMNKGQWEFVGDVIRITHDMKLIDGQQRLISIIKSGKAQPLHIQTGLSDKAFSVLDTGRTRSGGDVLFVAGYVHFNILAAAIKAEIYFREHGRVGGNVNIRRINTTQIMEWTEKHNIKLMQMAVEYAVHVLNVKGKFLAASTWAFVYFLLASVRGAREQADTFVNLLASGENLSMVKNSPIYLLREKLQDMKADKHAKAKKEIELKVRYIIAAWNAYRRGEKLKKLSIDTRSMEIEKPI